MIDRPESVAIWPPRPGLYRMRLVKDGPFVPVKIWFGLPVIDGEEQDRAPRWLCEIAGRTDFWEKDAGNYRCRCALDIGRAWPFCANAPISEQDYAYMLDHAEWSRQFKPSNPDANPRKAIDLATLAPIRF